MKIIKVACCEECPFLVLQISRESKCKANKYQDIGNIKGIPQWCTLLEEA